MKMSLIKKLSAGFILTVILSIVITSVTSNYMIDRRFNDYLMSENQVRINKVRRIVVDLYNEKKGFSNISKDEISRYAILEDFYIEVKNKNGNIIFSSGKEHLYYKKMMESMMGHNQDPSVNNIYSKMKVGEYMEHKYPLIKNKKSIGNITIGHFGISNLNERGVLFKKTLNRSFTLSATIALIVGLLISYIISRQIAMPLVKITKIANEMRYGNLEIRSEINTDTKEIEDLSTSINYLVQTLQEQEMLRRRLSSDMAHEIRTPLTTLKTHIEAIIDGIWEPTKERMESFYEEIERLTKLVDNLRELAKLEQSNQNLNKSKFNLSLEIEKIIDTFKPLYEKENYKIISNVSSEIYVLMDKDKLKQIMYNLLSNAHKYLMEDGTVEVTLNNEKDNIIIKVKDNGIGISQKDLPHIFKRFYRSDASRNKKTGGSGIGLTITKTLVESHKGSIYAQSKINEGSTFIISFPKNIVVDKK